jgi:2-dehydropantoate 2-reductase
VSLQNGVRNVPALTERLGSTRVIAGMIFFNVVWRRPACFRRTTGGPILIERSPDQTVRARLEKLCGRLGAAGLEASLRDDLPAVQNTKLLFNLNNALCALTDRTIRDELLARDCRVVLAAAIREGLEIVARAGLPLARLGKLDPRLAARVLGLPTPLFRVVARGMLEIDPAARSSMWEDLTAGKPTEIDYLNGELVTMAERAGMRAPINAAIVGLIRAAEARGGSPALSPADLRRAIVG